MMRASKESFMIVRSLRSQTSVPAALGAIALLALVGATAACEVHFAAGTRGPQPVGQPVPAQPAPPVNGGPAGGGTPTVAPPPPPPGAAASFTVSGTFHGAPTSYACHAFSPRAIDKDAAFYSPPGLIFLSCHTDPSGVSVSITVARLQPGDIIPGQNPMASGGRVAITQGAEVLSTDSGAAQGKITVTGWDANAKRITGTFSLGWNADSSGKAGNVSGQFDVANIQTAQ